MRRTLMLIAGAGSAALLLAAFGFQFLGGMPPCKLCYWQRYGHGVAIAASVLCAMVPSRWIAGLGALGAAFSSTTGVYHTGVERGWWEGPTSCTSGSIRGLSTEELMNQVMNAPLVRCDEVPWDMLGLSMASWNAVASAVLVAVWIAAILAPRR